MRHLNNKYGWKRSKEEIKRAFDARVDEAVKALPDCIYEVIQGIIEHKLRLPAQLIQVRPIGRRAIRECNLSDTSQVYEAVYFVIASVLEERGGVLSEFKAHRHSGSRVYMNPYYRRIYRFPPLKERKVEK